MIWRWAICSSLLATTATATVITGKVTLKDSRLTAVNKLGDYSGVVISLVPRNERPDPVPVRAKMIQKDKTFTPHILAVPTGSTVTFPNFDPIFHSAFSSYSGQIFDLGLYAPGTTKTVRFTRPGIVRVFCNIHPTMSAVIVVLDTPWFDVSRRDGSFSITAPPGDYQLNIYHERATQATLEALTRRLAVEGEAIQVPPIVISESGYLDLPHKNKYGRAYPPDSGEDRLYPGARQ